MEEYIDDAPVKRKPGFRKGQGFGQAVNKFDNELRGGEHDLSKVRVSKDIIDRMRANIAHGWRTEYQPEFADMAFELLTKENQCWTLKAIASVIGCTEKTLFRWIANPDKPEFAQAIAAGKSIQEVHFGSILLQGFKYSKSVEYVLANLHDWTAKREDTHKIIDLNREIAEREEFAHSHRLRKKVDWRKGTAQVIDADVVKQSPAAQLPPSSVSPPIEYDPSNGMV